MRMAKARKLASSLYLLRKVRKSWLVRLTKLLPPGKNLPKDVFVCSLRFSDQCFGPAIELQNTLPGAPRSIKQLVKDAIPDLLPHGREVKHRKYSERRAADKQRQEVVDITSCSRKEEVILPRGEAPAVKDVPVQFPGDVSEDVLAEHSYFTSYTSMACDLEDNDRSQQVDYEVGLVFDDESQHNNEYEDDELYSPSQSSSQSSQQSYQSTSAYTPSSGNRLLLVNENNLQELLKFCPQCGSPVSREDMKETENEGYQFSITLNCLEGCNITWHSPPPLPNIKGEGNLLLTANRHILSTNSKFLKCAHTDLAEEEVRRKKWFRPGSPPHNEVVTIQSLLKTLSHLTGCVHTSVLETYHSLYLKYLPKRIHFSYQAMVEGTKLAALDHSHHTGRKKSVMQSGQSSGEPRSWSKVTKRFGAAPVMAKKSYSYLKEMVNDTIKSAYQSKPRRRPNGPDTHRRVMASTERPTRREVIQNRQGLSRFKKLKREAHIHIIHAH
ncbi:predicted protein [Nematostella vectensis]|uniref:THAP-type domain-containing protein n=1 Tax=Nematostella vectensis TaxID=45351 RepID=A7S963_NEMVE|nr:predicted protein [Nematostella vectensis]|eukprot:XP_001631862.1 predicted protein [Nematostella vectensis]